MALARIEIAAIAAIAPKARMWPTLATNGDVMMQPDTYPNA
tara:strand:- start:4274 stop:4396 length:123 start_codon:yes stop_codon:yes gene_type:complete